MNLPSEVKEIAIQVSEKKQKEVQKVLNDIFNGTEKWEKQVNEIEVKDINDVMSIQLADAARRNAKIARLNAEKIFDAKRDELKIAMSDFKLEDNLWLKSKQIMQLKFKHIEELAKYKSEFVKRYEKEQFDLKIKKRLNQILPYKSDCEMYELENLTDEMFEILLNGLIAAKKEKEESEKQAELKRIAEEKAEKERVAKIEAENKRLEKEAKEKERVAKIEQKKREKQAEIEAKKQKELQAKIEAERKEKEIIEKVLQNKKDAEIKAKKEKEAKEKAQRLAPDKDKLLKLAKDLLSTSLPILESIEANNILNDVKVLLNKILIHVKNKTQSL